MAENIVDSLAIKLQLDPGRVIEVLNQAAAKMNELRDNAEGVSPAIDAIGDSAEKPVSRATSGIKRLGDESRKTADKIIQANRRTGSSFFALGAKIKRIRKMMMLAVYPVMGFLGFKRNISMYVEQADALEKLAKQTKSNVSDLDAWGKANAIAGGSAEAFNKALAEYCEKNKTLADDFLKLGQRMAGMSEERQKQFLKENGLSKEAAAIFTKATEEQQRLFETYRATAFTEKDAESARKYKNAMTEIGVASRIIGADLARMVMPAVIGFTKLWAAAASTLAEHTRVIRLLFAGLAAVLIGTKLNPAKLIAYIKAVGGLRKALLLAAAAAKNFSKSLLMNPITVAVAAVVALAVALDDLITFCEGGESVFGDLLKSLGYAPEEIEEIRKTIAGLGDAFSSLWEAIKPVGKFLLEVFGKAALVAIEGLVLVVGKLAYALAKIVEIGGKVNDALSGAFGKLGDKFVKLFGVPAAQGDPDLAPIQRQVQQEAAPDRAAKRGQVQQKAAAKAPRAAEVIAAKNAGNTVNNRMTQNNRIENNLTINANGGDPQAVANAAKEGVAKGMRNADILSLAASGVSK